MLMSAYLLRMEARWKSWADDISAEWLELLPMFLLALLLGVSMESGKTRIPAASGSVDSANLVMERAP